MIMVNNLFSIFDPSTYTMRGCWLLVGIPLLLSIPINKSIRNPSPSNSMGLLVIRELEKLIPSKEKGEIDKSLSIYLLIASLNLASLYCYNFTATAQLAVVLPLALMVWLILFTKGWVQHPQNLMVHMVPKGTPLSLINFMVIIELTRRLIRPLTLSIRLIANMTAGHVLMSLTSNIWDSNYLFWLCPLFSAVIVFLEIAVAFIQAYVFSSLITLYISEVK